MSAVIRGVNFQLYICRRTEVKIIKIIYPSLVLDPSCVSEKVGPNKQDRKYTYNVTMRRVHESLLPWKSNECYIFVSMCVRLLARVRVDALARGRVHVRACM